MPTYRQEWSYYEDGFDDTKMVFVVSDTYDGLFATTGVIPTQVFRVGSIKQDLNLTSGELAADEIQIQIDEAVIETTDDTNAVSFYLEAQDITVQRYIGVFLNTPPLPLAPLVADAIFIGVVSPKMKATDFRHNGAQFSPAINAMREWDSSGATFLDNAIADISLADLIDGNPGENVTGIDESWITANVADRLSYHKSAEGDPFGDRSAKFDKLFNLNRLLRKLADNLQQSMTDKGMGTFTIVYDVTALDATFSPARFVARQMGSGLRTRILRHYGVDSNPLLQPFVIKPADTKVLSLGDGVSDENSPWMHWRMVKPQGKTESAMSFRRCKNFTELLYAIAASFGLFVRFAPLPGNELRVTFISRQSLEQDEVFFRDATSASVDLSSDSSADAKPTLAVSTLYTPDGSELYPQSWPQTYQHETVYNSSLIPSRNHGWVMASDAYKAIISTGVPLKIYPMIEDAGYRDEQWLSVIPHNTVFYIGSTREIDVSPDKPYKAALGINSLMYVMTTVIDEAVRPSSLPIWLPIAAVHAKVDGVEQIYYSLSAYVNGVTKRDAQYYVTTYELEIPYINGFSLSSAGASPSWKNIKLGSKITIEEGGAPLLFIVVGIERNLAELTTKLKLHRTSRFAFTTPDGPASGISPEPEVVTTALPGQALIAQTTALYIADEDLLAGEAVRSYYSGTEWRIRRMRSQNSDYDSMVGIALNSAAAGDAVTVQTAGRVGLPDYTFTPGLPVYVRSSTLPTINISQSLLTAVSGGEDMIVDIGTADSTNSFVLNLFEQFILEV